MGKKFLSQSSTDSESCGDVQLCATTSFPKCSVSHKLNLKLHEYWRLKKLSPFWDQVIKLYFLTIKDR